MTTTTDKQTTFGHIELISAANKYILFAQLSADILQNYSIFKNYIFSEREYRMENKNFLITGAANGIGLEYARMGLRLCTYKFGIEA